jgi:integrase
MNVTGSLYRPMVTRWYDSAGKLIKKSDESAVRSKKVRSNTWRAKFKDRSGRQQSKSLGTKNKAEAQILLADLLDREQRGATDPYADHRDRPLTMHLADYIEYLESKESTRHHIQVTESRIEAILSGCRFEIIADLNSRQVSNWLAKQRRTGMSRGTSNHYIGAIKSFSTWFQEDRRHPENLLISLRKLNVDVDHRRQRRILSCEEMLLILESARVGKRFRWLNGIDREMCYQIVAYTGLRAAEVRSLTRQSLNLNSSPPTITVAAGYSKRRKRDELPLHPELARRLDDWLDDREELFPGTWHHRAAEMIKADMDAARVKWLQEAPDEVTRSEWDRSDFLRYETSEGTADFHSLRHRFITNLASSGVHPHEAKALARHSTITLTMDVYARHIDLAEKSSALSRLGDHAGNVAPDVALESVQHRNTQELSLVSNLTESTLKLTTSKDLGEEQKWEWRDLNPQPMDYECYDTVWSGSGHRLFACDCLTVRKRNHTVQGVLNAV